MILRLSELLFGGAALERTMQTKGGKWSMQS